MALKATIYKAAVNIADMDRHFYHDATLTLAQHPSENEQRMMLRLLAWICHADERLVFTKGLSADDEPEIWQRNDHNGLEMWIEMGLPDGEAHSQGLQPVAARGAVRLRRARRARMVAGNAGQGGRPQEPERAFSRRRTAGAPDSIGQSHHDAAGDVARGNYLAVRCSE